jgi:hypothetical protein
MEKLSDPIERPASVVSNVTIATTIADIDDSITTSSTPRGGSPSRFGNSNHDLPPSYEQSQAQHLDHLDRAATAPALSGTTQVFRTEVPPGHVGLPPPGPWPEHQHPPTPADGSSALLYHALAFTSEAAPPHADAYGAALTRPVAVPAIRPLDSRPEAAPLQAARLYARALQGAHVTAASFASFVDGLNAVALAAGGARPAERALGAATFAWRGEGAVPRDEWLGAYVALANARFFEPRGLQAVVATLAELVELARVPDRAGFRRGLVGDVLAAVGDGAGDEEERALGAVRALEPFVEPVGPLLPTMARDSEAVQAVARGMASMNLDEKRPLQDEGEAPSRVQTNASSSTEGDGAPKDGQPQRKFFTLFGMPISIGPVMTPAPPLHKKKDRNMSWEQWGEQWGKEWEKWGEQYGMNWGKWGDEYAKAWDNWGKEFSKYGGGPSRAVTENEAESPRDAPQPTEEDEEDYDSDSDTVSIGSLSSMSSASALSTAGSDPEKMFEARLAEIEASAQKDRAAGKKHEWKIMKEVDEGIRKAAEKRTKQELKTEKHRRKVEIRAQQKEFTAHVKQWRARCKAMLHKRSWRAMTKQERRDTIAQTARELAELGREWDWRLGKLTRQFDERNRADGLDAKTAAGMAKWDMSRAQGKVARFQGKVQRSLDRAQKRLDRRRESGHHGHHHRERHRRRRDDAREMHRRHHDHSWHHRHHHGGPFARHPQLPPQPQPPPEPVVAAPPPACGPFGSNGPFGHRGPFGHQGPFGPNGPLGPRGPLGPDGVLGPNGPLGGGGPLGPNGPFGPSGIFGRGGRGGGFGRGGGGGRGGRGERPPWGRRAMTEGDVPLQPMGGQESGAVEGAGRELTEDNMLWIVIRNLE